MSVFNGSVALGPQMVLKHVLWGPNPHTNQTLTKNLYRKIKICLKNEVKI